MVRAVEVSGAMLVKTVSAHALRPQRLGYDMTHVKSRICPFSRACARRICVMALR